MLGDHARCGTAQHDAQRTQRRAAHDRTTHGAAGGPALSLLLHPALVGMDEGRGIAQVGRRKVVRQLAWELPKLLGNYNVLNGVRRDLGEENEGKTRKTLFTSPSSSSLRVFKVLMGSGMGATWRCARWVGAGVKWKGCGCGGGRCHFDAAFRLDDQIWRKFKHDALSRQGIGRQRPRRDGAASRRNGKNRGRERRSAAAT